MRITLHCARRSCNACNEVHLVVAAACRASEAAPGLKQVDGKTVVQVFMLDNSVKQLLVENWSTVQVRCTSSRGSAPATGTIQESAQDVVSEVCVKMGVQDVERFSHCFALCETIDGITCESFCVLLCVNHSKLLVCYSGASSASGRGCAAHRPGMGRKHPSKTGVCRETIHGQCARHI